MEDRAILSLFQQRKEEAIDACRTEYDGYLTSLALRILHSPQEAEECVSDTYWQVWQRIPPDEPRHFRAYLAAICRYFAFGRLDVQHAQKRSAEIVELSEELSCCLPDRTAEDDFQLRELGELLDAFLRTLKAEPRHIFLRRYWFADSVKEIAARYGISESKVKTSLFRTRQQLRTYLESEGYTVRNTQANLCCRL